ncbi:MAG: DUF362 domain-containing protein [Candidatus Bathyarchaeia archaeon]
MEKSKVYWFGPRCPPSYVVKGQRLFEEAELYKCFDKGDIVAMKIHCGEWNNTGYLRPSLVASIVEMVREYGGDPFVTDTTTLLYGPYIGRTQAQHQYKTAARNGFTEATLGCPFIVADGDYGMDDVKVEIDGNYLKFTYLAAAIANADAMIAVSHFKGHITGVFGGAIKNLGIGCCSKRGKAATHLNTHPQYGVYGYAFNPEKCKGEECPLYETCSENCPVGAFKVVKEKPYARWDRESCVGCGGCWYRVRSCDVMEFPANREFVSPAVFADSAAAVIKHLGKDHVGFINYAIDISPSCDCAMFTDSWILPNLGVFASRDMVAIDKACLDAADRAQAVPGSKAFDEGVLDEPWLPGHEKFTFVSIFPNYQEVSQWIQINATAKLGVGSSEYELIEAELEDLRRYNQPPMRDHTTGYRLRNKYRIAAPKPDPECYQKVPKITLEELTKRP